MDRYKNQEARDKFFQYPRDGRDKNYAVPERPGIPNFGETLPDRSPAPQAAQPEGASKKWIGRGFFFYPLRQGIQRSFSPQKCVEQINDILVNRPEHGPPGEGDEFFKGSTKSGHSSFAPYLLSAGGKKSLPSRLYLPKRSSMSSKVVTSPSRSHFTS